MGRFPRLSQLAIIAASAFFGFGCATIIHGTTQKIPVTSDPPGVKLSVDASGSYTTPTEIELKRKEDHLLQFSKEGYLNENVKIQSVVSGAVAGNILAGGLIGWGVDAATGAQYRLVPETVHVVLRPESPAAATIKLATSSSSNFAPAVIEERIRTLKDLRDKGLITEEEYVAERKQILEASRPGLEASRPPTLPVVKAPLAPGEQKRWVKVTSAEAHIFDGKPEAGVDPPIVRSVKQGEELEYTGLRESGRGGIFLQVKSGEGQHGWISAADVEEIRDR